MATKAHRRAHRSKRHTQHPVDREWAVALLARTAATLITMLVARWLGVPWH